MSRFLGLNLIFSLPFGNASIVTDFIRISLILNALFGVTTFNFYLSVQKDENNPKIRIATSGINKIILYKTIKINTKSTGSNQE